MTQTNSFRALNTTLRAHYDVVRNRSFVSTLFAQELAIAIKSIPPRIFEHFIDQGGVVITGKTMSGLVHQSAGTLAPNSLKTLDQVSAAFLAPNGPIYAPTLFVPERVKSEEVFVENTTVKASVLREIARFLNRSFTPKLSEDEGFMEAYKQGLPYANLARKTAPSFKEVTLDTDSLTTQLDPKRGPEEVWVNSFVQILMGSSSNPITRENFWNATAFVGQQLLEFELMKLHELKKAFLAMPSHNARAAFRDFLGSNGMEALPGTTAELTTTFLKATKVLDRNLEASRTRRVLIAERVTRSQYVRHGYDRRLAA